MVIGVTTSPITLAVDSVKIKIDGLKGPLLDNARANLDLYDIIESERKHRQSHVLYLVRQGTKQIEKSLEPFGYYNSKVVHNLERPNEKEWHVTYQVDIGEPTMVRKVAVNLLGEGRSTPQFDDVLNGHQIKVGEVLSHAKWELLKQQLTFTATQLGYLDAKFKTTKIDVYPATNAADLTLEYDTGALYHIAEISVDQSQFNPEFIDRYVNLKPGDPYNADKVNALRQNLLRSNFFSEVPVNGVPDRENHTVAVRYYASPNARNHYLVGAGYSTDHGARIKLGYDRRWLNKRGHSLHSYIDTSQRYGRSLVEYRVPGRIPYQEYTGYRLGIERDEYNDLFSERDHAGVINESRTATTHLAYSVKYQREQFKYGEDSHDWFENEYVLARADLTWYSVEDHQAPDSGFRIHSAIETASADLGSDQDLIALTLDGNYTRKLSDTSRVSVAMMSGAIEADDLDLVPTNVRFFLGGDNSIRGYGYRSIGIKPPQGKVNGGRYMAALSLEYEREFRPKWSYAYFVDAGDAFDDEFNLRVGIGAGVNWYSPVGPIRAYFAHGFDDAGDSFRIHIRVGDLL